MALGGALFEQVVRQVDGAPINDQLALTNNTNEIDLDLYSSYNNDDEHQ